MKPKQNFIFFLVYSFIVFTETIIANLEGLETLHFISKPLIVLSLMFFFLKNMKQLDKSSKRFTLLALVFSLTGDVLLLFAPKSEYYFIGGLIAFLTAHIMYSFVFLKQRRFSKYVYAFVIALLIYALILFRTLQPGLGDLLIPVIIYMIVILIMVTTAFLRRQQVNTLNFNLVFIGAIAFMVSDSLLAINKFTSPLAFADISIMFTYALAQLLIVLGITQQ